MRRLAFLTIILLLASAAPAPAQPRKNAGKFKWETEMCLMEGTYDTRRYTRAQLENTYKMWHLREFDMDTFDAVVFKLEDLKKLRTAASLDAEYAQKSAALKKLAIVNDPFWQAFRAKKLVEIEREYQLARASVQAFETPSALRDVKFADACVQKFAPPLAAGGDALLGIWREVNEENRRKNSDPERIRREYEAKLASNDKFRHAQVEVLTFGWWNCVNAEIDRADDWEAIYKNFEKLFKNVKRDCEEP